jgi:hypothetical protein
MWKYLDIILNVIFMSNKTIQLNPVFLNTSGSKTNSNTNKNKTIKKEKPLATTLVKPNKVKKELLAKIKDFQVKAEENGIERKEIKTDKEEFDEVFNDEFNKSLNFLQELSKQKSEKHQKKKEHRNTLKKGRIENEIHMQIATELPADLMDIKVPSVQHSTAPTVQHSVAPTVQHSVAPTVQHSVAPTVQHSTAPTVQHSTAPTVQHSVAPTVQHSAIKRNAQTPPYGILKQGVKPTYRDWHNKTQKLHFPSNESKPLIKIDRSDDITPQSQSERSKILETIKNEYKLANENKRIEQLAQQQVQQQQTVQQQAVQQDTIIPPLQLQSISSIPESKPKKPTRYKKRITKTMKYKLGTQGRKVSILIKNNQTRRRVQHEIGLLKQKNIMEIKNYLREKNLLKVGSYAPNDVLRQMYEQSILAGDIENKSKDTFIHNYFNPSSEK